VQNTFSGKLLYHSIACGFEAGFLISQISQQVAEYSFVEAKNVT